MDFISELDNMPTPVASAWAGGSPQMDCIAPWTHTLTPPAKHSPPAGQVRKMLCIAPPTHTVTPPAKHSPHPEKRHD